MIKYQKLFNRGHSSPKKHRPENELRKKLNNVHIMWTTLLKSWCSWPGFLRVACEGPGLIVRSQTAFLIFHGSQSTMSAKIQQEETLLSPNRPESHTKGPWKVTPSSCHNNCSSHRHKQHLSSQFFTPAESENGETNVNFFSVVVWKTQL